MKGKKLIIIPIVLMIISIVLFQSNIFKPTNKILQLNVNKENSQKVKLQIFNRKSEISESLLKLKQDYESTHKNIELDIESVGGGANYSVELNSKCNLGEAPDIFMIEGRSDFLIQKDILEDLSNEPWAEQLVVGSKDAVLDNGQIYGMPANIEGYGFLYNKDLFEKAGITEQPITISELTEACEKLQNIGVTPFANGYNEWWILGNHTLNIPFSMQENPSQFIQDVKEGKTTLTENEIFKQWIDLLDLTIKYGNENCLTTNYGEQVNLFATGKAAMMQQGNWSKQLIDKINPNCNIGILPMPINDEGINKIFTGVPMYWAINKNSPYKQEAKEFLNWLVSSDIGKKYIVEDFEFIPAVSSIDLPEKDMESLSGQMQKYLKENNVLSWQFLNFPANASLKSSESIQMYAAGKISKEELLQQIQANMIETEVK